MCVSSNSKRSRRPPDPEAGPEFPENTPNAHSHANNVAPMITPRSRNGPGRERSGLEAKRTTSLQWSIPKVNRYSQTISLAVAVAATGLGSTRLAWSAPPAEPPKESADSMKAYTEAIPGTDIKFDMIPIPGGTFEMGSPPGQESPDKDEDRLIQVAPGPQHALRIAPFWMGKHEVTWEEYDQFAFSL